jgi:hypothetical protein
MAVKGLMMHQKLTGTGMVVSRAAMLQPRIIAAAKNRRGTGVCTLQNRETKSDKLETEKGFQIKMQLSDI